MTRKSTRSRLAPTSGQVKASPHLEFKRAIDPVHPDIFGDTVWVRQEIVEDVWRDKYKYSNEQSPKDTFIRVADAIYAKDLDEQARNEALAAMFNGLWMPGGRIIAGAGTQKRVTLNNCYTNKRLEDSLEDIMQGLTIAALTQQQGGGIGTCFHSLRPEGAVLRRTGAKASGPLPFMDMWNAMCATIMSAGDRRGAMMATIGDTHPDLPQFIKAKREKGRLTNFNVSILVSDAFMSAVEDDEEWLLYFNVPPKDRIVDAFEDDKEETQYVYSTWRARDLWRLIMENTYEYSEPGVIFIDRINDLNNLKYLEYIDATNPCGEQPLPPNGTCNLGAINLARLVNRPFKSDATFNWDLLQRITRIGVRFLDNVIDVCRYPLDAQENEQLSKRRLGLGVSGLADCLAQLGLRYGSAPAASLTEQIFQSIALTAYDASMKLAVERGSFPLYDRSKFLQGFAGQKFSDEYHTRLKDGGIRNGVILTVAPTGTTSILFGNISSGIEPTFQHQYTRRVRQSDNSFREYQVLGYNYDLWSRVAGGTEPLPSAMVTTEELTIQDHVVMQAAVQRWVDASVSKTINVASNTSFEEFQKVYSLAYALGCKGCTTYRPSDVRGSILSRSSEAGKTAAIQSPPRSKLPPRLELLQGLTHKVKWPSLKSALYITTNWQDGKPYEIFFNSKDARFQEWWTALSLMISAILRKADGDIGFISEELMSVHSVHDVAWIKVPDAERPRFFGSLIAYIGYVLGQDFDRGHLPEIVTEVGEHRSHSISFDPNLTEVEFVKPESTSGEPLETCPSCLAPALEHKEGCKTCLNCGFSDCN